MHDIFKQNYRARMSVINNIARLAITPEQANSMGLSGLGYCSLSYKLIVINVLCGSST